MKYCILVLFPLFVSFSDPQNGEQWKQYIITHNINTTNLNSRRLFADKKKAAMLENNIANFYLYENGALIIPQSKKVQRAFFTPGCLCFKFNDTLLLNSGLGTAAGVGVGIKIYKDKFTGTLHANAGNKSIYKYNKKEEDYLSDLSMQPITQSLKLLQVPTFSANEILTGEYRATYKPFYAKVHGKDVLKKYQVRIIFKCQITGIDNIRERIPEEEKSN